MLDVGVLCVFVFFAGDVILVVTSNVCNVSEAASGKVCCRCVVNIGAACENIDECVSFETVFIVNHAMDAIPGWRLRSDSCVGDFWFEFLFENFLEGGVGDLFDFVFGEGGVFEVVFESGFNFGVGKIEFVSECGYELAGKFRWGKKPCVDKRGEDWCVGVGEEFGELVCFGDSELRFEGVEVVAHDVHEVVLDGKIGMGFEFAGGAAIAVDVLVEDFGNVASGGVFDAAAECVFEFGDGGVWCKEPCVNDVFFAGVRRF